MIDRSACHVKELRIALDGCYPSFWDTDLVMRTIRSSFRPQLVSRLSAHDLLIRGPFSRGSKRLRVTDAATQLWQRLRTNIYEPLSLHVCSENHLLPNYQSYIQSGCDYGIGHEIINDSTYFRSPHWHNYIDFSAVGIHGPEFWPRLGVPIQINELTQPIHWNSGGSPTAIFVTSNMTSERQILMSELVKIIPITGFGKAFNSSIRDHTSSGFIKRDLLRGYQYCFCPENSLAPGYYTEKIPEAFISGAIPISYCDSKLDIDFSKKALINLADFFDGTTLDVPKLQMLFDGIKARQELLSTPLIDYDLSLVGVRFHQFISQICFSALD